MNEAENPPVGVYDVTMNDITKKAAKKVYPEWDPRNKKFGFGSLQDYQRGTPIKPEKVPEEEMKIFEGIHSGPASLPKAKQNKAPFLSTEFRFSNQNLKGPVPPPPGSYETDPNQWNTRTYNVLFTNL